MFRNYILPLVALSGIAVAIFTVVWGDQPAPSAPPVSEAPESPYRTSVAGSGIVEANTENISIGTHVPGIVSRVFVKLGSDVKAGDPLFAIDDRVMLADIDTRRLAVNLAKLQLAEASYDVGIVEPLAPKGATSKDDVMKKRFAAQRAAAYLAKSEAELKSGETLLEQLTVRAPVDGRILQLKVHPGEFAPDAATATGQAPLILLGGITPLHVRVDIDENDAWLVHSGASATGCLRGNKDIKTQLVFVRFEPYVIPKKSLTGDGTERVDTRVLQTIFSFTRGTQPIFIGQQMDVFINAEDTSE